MIENKIAREHIALVLKKADPETRETLAKAGDTLELIWAMGNARAFDLIRLLLHHAKDKQFANASPDVIAALNFGRQLCQEKARRLMHHYFKPKGKQDET